MTASERGHRSDSPRNRPGRGMALACFAALMVSGCTATARYEWLSFFFDGVPEPGGPVEIVLQGPPAPREPWAEIRARQNRTAQYQQHAPYAARECSQCHVDRPKDRVGILSIEEMSALRVPIEQLCERCHEPPKARFVHAPVQLRECGLCHHPHQSLNAHLLLEPQVETLCTVCHTARTWPSQAEHEEYGTRDCAACHDPHESDDPLFLRDSWRRHEYPVIGPPMPLPSPVSSL